MDTTRIDELLIQLETSDPAEVPDVADALTAALAEGLDGAKPDDRADSETEVETETS